MNRFPLLVVVALAGSQLPAQIGREVAVPVHLQDGQEFTTPLKKLLTFGESLFTANWTSEEGGGRPLTKGTGAGLSDPSSPLVFPRNFNRISAPDMNSCAGCHNKPVVGGGGEFGTLVFVLGQRFDFSTFDHSDPIHTRGAVDEAGNPVTEQSIANGRKTVAMHGSGYIEMLAREMTIDLQAIGNTIRPGGSAALTSKGVSFGVLQRTMSGTWDTSLVTGLPAPSVASPGPASPPSLIIQPMHQAGAVISLRVFTNNAFNHHHGIQSTERFGIGTDPDGDGFTNELTRADVTAVTMFQAALPVPGRVIPKDPAIRAAIINGAAKFRVIGCANCHVPSLPLYTKNFCEPNPFNPSGNLRLGDGVPSLCMDLTDGDMLPTPRLKQVGGVIQVPAFTDLKLHDITSGPNDPNREPLDQNQPTGSVGFFAGNGKFITRKLWGIANQHPFGPHGKFTTMREAVLAHSGEALASRTAFTLLPVYDRDSIIEFLKSLQILPKGAGSLCVDEELHEIGCPAGIDP
jgi:Di-haem oxidoreductase, putative peroxidase